MVELMKDVETPSTSEKYVTAWGKEESNDNHTVQIVTNGSPSVVVVDLLGSVDGINFSCIASHTMNNTETGTGIALFHVVNKPVTIVKARLAELDGGVSPQVSVYYLRGKQ